MFYIFENLTLPTLQYPYIIIFIIRFHFLVCDIYSKNVGKRKKNQFRIRGN